MNVSAIALPYCGLAAWGKMAIRTPDVPAFRGGMLLLGKGTGLFQPAATGIATEGEDGVELAERWLRALAPRAWFCAAKVARKQ